MFLQPAGVNISMKILVLGKAGFWEMQGVMLEALEPAVTLLRLTDSAV